MTYRYQRRKQSAAGRRMASIARAMAGYASLLGFLLCSVMAASQWLAILMPGAR